MRDRCSVCNKEVEEGYGLDRLKEAGGEGEYEEMFCSECGEALVYAVNHGFLDEILAYTVAETRAE